MSSALAKRIKHGRYVNEIDQKQTEDELIVIGYACNIFRDDEKADFFDEERHLIKHPSDDSVSTDRFDGRLYLHDLDKHDAANVGPVPSPQETSQGGDVDESELEFERYRDLMAADDYDEERNDLGVPPVAETPVDSPVQSATSSPFIGENDEQRSRRKDRQYVPPPELELPNDMQLPDTMQTHVIIAKTAAFVATKGPQMEIVIKAKQKTKDNHFEFLTFDNVLRPYYEHVLSMIKKGRYQFVEEPEESDEDDEDGDYLHPSLRISSSSSSLSNQAKQANSQQQQAQVSSQPRNVDLQPIIDRLAEYVARNGEEFEGIVRSRNDPLYNFIESDHPFNRYYRERIYFYRAEYRRMAKADSKAVEQQRQPTQEQLAVIFQSITSKREEKPDPKRFEKPEAAYRKLSPKGSPGTRYTPPITGDREFRDRSSSRSHTRTSRKYKRSRSESDDESENTRRRSAKDSRGRSKVDKKEDAKKKTKRDGSPRADKAVKFSPGVDNEEKAKEDVSIKKMQEERRAKAKMFLKMLKDRDEKDSTADPSETSQGDKVS